MFETLEFNKVLDILAEHALSESAKNRIKRLAPFLSEAEVSRHLKETTEARHIMEQCGNPPLSPMNELDKLLSFLNKGAFLMPEQLESIAQFLTACRRLKTYLKKAESSNTSVASYGNSIFMLPEIEDEINRSIRGGQVDDRASSLLSNIRRQIENTSGQIKAKLDSILRSSKI